jgi:hypothetical protein
MRTKLIQLAASVAAFGTLLHTAHGAAALRAYDLNINFTNAEAGFWTVGGAPRTTGTLFVQVLPSATSVQTDGTGSISGDGTVKVTYNTAGLPYSRFAVMYSGQVSAPAGSIPTVTMFIRGNGFTVDGNGGTNANLNSLSLKFVGQPGVNPLNTGQIRIVGQLTGTIHGDTPLAESATTLPAMQAVITGSTLNQAAISSGVAQSATRMLIFDPSFTGSGTVGTTGSYRFNELGLGQNRGATFVVSGSLGAYTNVIGTNAVAFTAPASAQLKGKVCGQVVSGTVSGSQITATLVR